MDFISENYFWIILIVIVVLMAIVGYFAEKNGFIANAQRPMRSSGKIKSNDKPIVIANKGIDELLDSQVSEEDVPVELPVEIEVDEKKSKKKFKSKKLKKDNNVEPPVIEESNYDVITPISDDSFVNNDLNSNMETTADDLVVYNNSLNNIAEAPISDDIMAPLVSEPVSEDSGVIDESLFAPLESVNNTELNPIEVTPLQEVDSEAPVVNEEEDIWKF